MQIAATELGVLREQAEPHAVVTGEPDDGKPSCPVRREAARNRTCPGRHLTARPTHPPGSSTQHLDRNAQFRYLNEHARDHRDAGDPVISVDSKKKELIGERVPLAPRCG